VTLSTTDSSVQAGSGNDAPGIIFGVDDRPPPLQWLAFSFQHLMVAFAAMIGVPLAFSSIVKLGFDDQTAVISGVLVAGGVVTMIQSLGIGPIGARLPLVNDATFKFLGPLTLAYKFGGFGAIYAAAIISGFVIAALGFVVAQIQRFFNTFIVGAFLIITGVSLMPIALNNLLAIGKPYEATTAAFVTAALPLAVMIFFQPHPEPLSSQASNGVGPDGIRCRLCHCCRFWLDQLGSGCCGAVVRARDALRARHSQLARSRSGGDIYRRIHGMPD